MKIMPPIVDDVRTSGDKAVLSYTQTFEKATSLTSSVIRAPFSESMVQLPAETMAVDVSIQRPTELKILPLDSIYTAAN